MEVPAPLAEGILLDPRAKTMKAAHRSARSFEVYERAEGLRLVFPEEDRTLDLAAEAVIPANAECLFLCGEAVLELDYRTLEPHPARREKVAHVLDHEAVSPTHADHLRRWLAAHP